MADAEADLLDGYIPNLLNQKIEVVSVFPVFFLNFTNRVYYQAFYILPI